MTAEAEAEIANIVNGPTPGQLMGTNFDRAFECRACQEKNLAAASNKRGLPPLKEK